ncbi:MAG: hypothetical protein ACE5F9_00195 [Phycisphaerae bacterium]
MAFFLNMLLPGTGLIVLRREWLGFCLVVLFGMCGHVAVAGWLIAPETIPTRWSGLALALAISAWILAQWLYRRQKLFLKQRAAGLDILLREARSALQSCDLATARRALESGLALDDERAELQDLTRALESVERERIAAPENSETHPAVARETAT